MRDVGTAWPRPQDPTGYSDTYSCGIAPHRTRSVALPRVTAPLGLSGTSLAPSEPVQPVLTPVRCGAQAVAFHLLNTGPEGFPLAIVKQHSYNYELAAMYVMVLGFFTVYGAGPWSVDEQVLGGEIEFYQGLLPGGTSEEE